jgi:Tol biopolymer transport system component
LDEVTARPLAGTEDAIAPFWSPDGLWIGFFAEGKLKKTPVVGGAVQLIAGTVADARGGTWAPDDTILFADGSSPIYRVSSAGGSVTPVTRVDSARQETTHRWPSFLPDHNHFLYTVRSALAEQRGVYVGSLDGKTRKLLFSFDSGALYAPPGYVLYLDGDSLMGQRFDADRLELIGQPFTVVGQVGHSTTGQVAVSVSAAGTLTYAGAGLQIGRLTWFERGGNRADAALPEGDYSDFRLSPDEKRLAASMVNPKTGQPEIWMTDIDRGNSSKFVFGSTLNSSVVWSPDGTRLLFRTNRNGVVDFYQKSAAGGGNEEPVVPGTTWRDAGMPAVTLLLSDWSRNGNLIFSVPMLTTSYDLALLPLAGLKPVTFIDSPLDQMHGNFSPDGRLVAYSSNESGPFEVYVQTFPRSDRKWKISTSGGYEPRWRGDGGEIYYLTDDRKLMAVSVEAGPAFGRPKLLFQTQVRAGVSAYRTNYVPTRDGQRFLINTQTGDPAPIPIMVFLNWTAGLKK